MGMLAVATSCKQDLLIAGASSLQDDRFRVVFYPGLRPGLCCGGPAGAKPRALSTKTQTPPLAPPPPAPAPRAFPPCGAAGGGGGGWGGGDSVSAMERSTPSLSP